MKRLYKIFIPVLFIPGIITSLVSCKKYNEWGVDASHNRLFRPSSLQAEVSEVFVTLKWKNMPNTNRYRIELSKDSLKFENITNVYEGAAEKSSDGYSFAVPDLLDPASQYSARIKGIDTTGVTPDSEWQAVAFKSGTEQIMYAIKFDEITSEGVTLRWEVPNIVTHFMIGGNRYDISSTEAAEGVKVITGLTENTGYIAELYYNNNIRGTQPFSTYPANPTGPSVVEVPVDADLATLISTATTGTTFILPKNFIYSTDNSISIPAGVSITIFGEYGGAKPILALNELKLPASAGILKFENVDFTGYQYQNGVPTSTKRNYIFNHNAATNIEEIAFEDCILRNFGNSVLRFQSNSSMQLDKFTVDRCAVYDIGDNGVNGTYAFLHIQVSKVNNISLTNSTFYNIGYGLILHNTNNSNSLVIENNTFYNVVGNGRYLIDYSANYSPTTTFKFANNIIAKTLSPAGTGRGIRYSGTNLAVTGSYKTSDVAFAGNDIPATLYDGSGTDLFVSPATGDFTIKDNFFVGKSSAGDPRWRIQ